MAFQKIMAFLKYLKKKQQTHFLISFKKSEGPKIMGQKQKNPKPLS